MNLSDKTTSGAPLTWADLSKQRKEKTGPSGQDIVGEQIKQAPKNFADIGTSAPKEETVTADTTTLPPKEETTPVSTPAETVVQEASQGAKSPEKDIPPAAFDPFSTEGIQYITPDQMRGDKKPLAERMHEPASAETQQPESVAEPVEEKEEKPPVMVMPESVNQTEKPLESEESVKIEESTEVESSSPPAIKVLKEVDIQPEEVSSEGAQSETSLSLKESEPKEQEGGATEKQSDESTAVTENILEKKEDKQDEKLDQEKKEETPPKTEGKTEDTPDKEGDDKEKEGTLPPKDGPQKGQNYDLLAQISAEDKMMNVKEEKRQFFMTIMASVMGFMFQFDAYRKTHNKLFSRLYASWKMFVFFLLGCGGLTALLMIYLVMYFPSFVETYLRTAGIQTSSLKVNRFSSTQVVIENMQAKDGSFYVGRTTLTYTLPELVRGHIREALMQGVQINLDNKKPYWNMAEIYKLYQSSFASKMVQIENVMIPEGMAYLTYNDDTVPVKFSVKNNYVDGILRSELPFKTEENTIMEANGTLSVSGGRKLNWSLDLMSARLLSPKVREISGGIKATSSQGVFQDVKTDLTFTDLYSSFSSNIDVKINQGSVDGRVTLKMAELNRDNKRATQSYTFDFSDLKVSDELTTLETKNDIIITANDVTYPHFQLKNGQVKLKGHLNCLKGECTYQLSDPGEVELLGAEVLLSNHAYISKKPLVFKLETQPETPLFQRNTTGDYAFNFVIPELYFDGHRNAEVSPVKLELKNVAYTLKESLTQGESLSVKVADGNLETPDYALKAISADVMNPFSTFPTGKLLIKEVKLLDKKGFLQVPFTLDLDLKHEHSQAKLTALDGQIQFDFDGAIRLTSGTFRGNFSMKPIQLKDLKVPLNEIYPQFPAEIQHTAGTISMMGEVDYRDATMISGPMFVLFDNVSGHYKNFGFEGLNTVLSVDTLMPFSTKPDQDLFVAKLTGAFPVQNLQALFQIENPYIFLNKLSLDLGNIPLSMDTLAIPFESNNTIIYLQNKRVELSKLAPGLNLPQPLEMTGFADVMIPLYIRNQGLTIQGAEANIRDALFIAKPDNIPEFFEGATTYKTLNSSVTANSIPNSNKVKVQVSLEDDNIITRRKFHQTWDLDLNQILRPVAILPLPQEISIKKKMFDTEQ